MLAGILSEQGYKVMIDTFIYPIRKMARKQFGYVDENNPEHSEWLQWIEIVFHKNTPKKLMHSIRLRHYLPSHPKNLPSDYLIIHDVSKPEEYEFCREHGIVIYMQGTYRSSYDATDNLKTEIQQEEILYPCDCVIRQQNESQGDSYKSLFKILQDMVESGRHMKKQNTKPVA